MKTPAWLKKWRAQRRIADYQRRGRVPWSRGYEECRENELAEALRAGSFNPHRLSAGWGAGLDERLVEIPWLFSRLKEVPGRFLDAGSTLNRKICLQNPLLKKKQVHICTLAPEADCFWRDGVSYLYEDLRNLPYRDGWFDTIACISVLEHVGMDNTRHYTQNPNFAEASPEGALQAMRELKRVLRPGGILYVTVPFGRAVSHGWLRIFNNSGVEELIQAFHASAREEFLYRYTPAGWQTCSRQEASQAGFFDPHAGIPWNPGLPASSGAVCCLELHKGI